MANLGFYFLCVLSLFVSVTLLNPISCYAQYFFVFGDSLYDPGNNKYVTPDEHIPSYYPPYGTTFFNHSTGRNSDGRVLPDFIATKLNLPFPPPVLEPNADFSHGASFASGGAGVSDDNNKALNFRDQYEKLKEIKAIWTNELNGNTTEVEKRLAEAVYLICMGGNDYFSYFFAHQDATFAEMQAFVKQVQANFTTIVTNIYDLGARKFMFQNAAPIGCLPMFKQQFNISGDGCVPKAVTLAAIHNAALPGLLRSLQDKLQGFTFSIFDYFTAISDRISHPKEYGFKGGDNACCGYGSHNADHCGKFPYCVCANATEYVFWDGGHNTDEANNQLAELMWNKNSPFVSPRSMSELFDLEVPRIQQISSI